MTKANKKFKVIWLRGALRMMNEGGITFGLIALTAFSLGALYFTQWAWAALAILAVLAVVAVVAFIGTARTMEEANHISFVNNWIASAGTPEEREYRQHVFSDDGLDAALSAAGISAMSTAAVSMPFNIDGTPMVEGTGMDIHGNPFGVTPVETGQFHEDTGGFVSPSTSYHDPFKMD
ncbi:hypothetical protein [Burkholderia cenocepacia]|uniref:hypothetical protein n=1 Tax=Burkholderia cenocepacia TaxID=95486 RepID=UPI00076D3A7B|nr:hypothetical protein [Burkholderia cenocepacia]KWU17875.1 hypothetical protein AS149_14450 [Burkholderia cenocepacia]